VAGWDTIPDDAILPPGEAAVVVYQGAQVGSDYLFRFGAISRFGAHWATILMRCESAGTCGAASEMGHEWQDYVDSRPATTIREFAAWGDRPAELERFDVIRDSLLAASVDWSRTTPGTQTPLLPPLP
jgi:hypothetical protein